MKKIHESLFILYKCHTTIERAYKGMQANLELNEHDPADAFKHNMMYYMIMEAVSFLDEYNGAFTGKKVEPAYKLRVQEVRKIVAPIIRKISEWKDLRKFRHHIVAHPWRDEKNGDKFVVPDINVYNVPRNQFEFLLLRDLVGYVYKTIKAEFSAEVAEAFIHYIKLIPSPKPKRDYSSINNELEAMKAEYDAISEELGKNYNVDVIGYIFTSDES